MFRKDDQSASSTDFAKGAFYQLRSIHIADCNVIKVAHQPRRQLMVKVEASVGEPGVDGGDASPLACSLRHPKLLLDIAVDPLRLDHRAVRENGKILQAQIDADSTHGHPRCRDAYLDGNVQKPIAASILGKARWTLPDAFNQCKSAPIPPGRFCGACPGRATAQRSARRNTDFRNHRGYDD